jgi:hypothetical protein
MKIMSTFMSFIWIVIFDLWNFKSTSFGIYQKIDYDSIRVYWNNILFHKN